MTTDTFTDAVFGPASGDPEIWFVKIEHPELEDDVLVCSPAPDDITRSGSIVYTAFPFDIVPPGEHQGRLGTGRMVFPNTGTVTIGGDSINLVEELRRILPLGRPTITIDVALASDPDSIVFGPVVLGIMGAVPTRTEISLDIGPEEAVTRRFPEGSFDNFDWPALIPGS